MSNSRKRRLPPVDPQCLDVSSASESEEDSCSSSSHDFSDEQFTAISTSREIEEDSDWAPSDSDAAYETDDAECKETASSNVEEESFWTPPVQGRLVRARQTLQNNYK